MWRARDEVECRSGRTVAVASHAEHRRLLAAFAAASRDGDVAALADLLAADALLITDGGPAGVRSGRGGGTSCGRSRGAKKIAAFVTAGRRGSA